MNISSFYRWIPAVKDPVKPLTIKQKIFWSALVLVIFFIMGSVEVAGVAESATGFLEQLQIILASNIGTLITVGIGPIVLASIILQMLVGTKIIKLNLSDPAQRSVFTGLQKLLTIGLAFFEAIIYSAPGRFLSPDPGMRWFVILQVATGSIILMFLDEVVQKYGVGSGIGLFIAGGVSQTVIWRSISPIMEAGSFIGLIPQFLANLFRGNPALIILLPLLMSFVVFFIVVFFESVYVNIPIAMGRRGLGGRFPVKLLYVSNIPVIFAAAFFANIQFIAFAIRNTGFGKVFGVFSENQIVGGLACYTKAPFGILIDPGGVLGSVCYVGFLDPLLAVILHILVYAVLFLGACVIFGVLWVEIGGQGPEDIAEQFQSAGLFIPGFRKDPSIVKAILYKYIPTITMLGSFIVGFLAVFADLTGALGSGTGILLTVGIVYRLYEELAREQVLTNVALLRKIIKGG